MTDRELDAIDVMFLLSCGISIEEALRRVSWKPEAASRWAERHRNTRLLKAVAPLAWQHRKAAAA